MKKEKKSLWASTETATRITRFHFCCYTPGGFILFHLFNTPSSLWLKCKRIDQYEAHKPNLKLHSPIKTSKMIIATVACSSHNASYILALCCGLDWIIQVSECICSKSWWNRNNVDATHSVKWRCGLLFPQITWSSGLETKTVMVHSWFINKVWGLWIKMKSDYQQILLQVHCKDKSISWFTGNFVKIPNFAFHSRRTFFCLSLFGQLDRQNKTSEGDTLGLGKLFADSL